MIRDSSSEGPIVVCPNCSHAFELNRADPSKSTPHVSLLSAREREVLVLLARGFSYAEISLLKKLSVHTIQTHIKNLYGKLSVHSKNEAVFEATRLGILGTTRPGA